MLAKTGRIDNLRTTATGVSNVDLGDTQIANATVSASSVSKARLNVINQANVSASDVSNVAITGPAAVTQRSDFTSTVTSASQNSNQNPWNPMDDGDD